MDDNRLMALVAEVYAFLANRPRFDGGFARHDLPANGIYVFYEAGEVVTIGGTTVERIVRVGTHRGQDRLSHRLRTHFAGTRRRSVFRRRLGEALLSRNFAGDAQLAAAWADRRTPLPDMEAMVSQVLRERFTFCCVAVDAVADRLTLERGLIALLSRHPVGRPSAGWLGRYASNAAIQQSGLWNTLGTNAEPITAAQLFRLRAEHR